MSDNYKVISDDLNTIANDLKDIILDYKEQVIALQTLANDISGSSDWVDPDLKPAYVQNIKDYVNLFKKIYSGLKVYRRYVIRKGRHSDEIENLFSS